MKISSVILSLVLSFVVAYSFFGVSLSYAEDGPEWRVGSGEEREIFVEANDGGCKLIENDRNEALMVPTKYSTEWDNFRINRPNNVYISPCPGVYACREIIESGGYTLKSDITSDLDSGEVCIEISADDVTIDGDGYKLTSMGSGDGVEARYQDNIEIKNLGVEDYSVGINIYQVDGITLEDNTVCGSDDTDVVLSDVSGETVSGNTCGDSDGLGDQWGCEDTCNDYTNTWELSGLDASDKENCWSSCSACAKGKGKTCCWGKYSGCDLNYDRLEAVSDKEGISDTLPGSGEYRVSIGFVSFDEAKCQYKWIKSHCDEPSCWVDVLKMFEEQNEGVQYEAERGDNPGFCLEKTDTDLDAEAWLEMYGHGWTCSVCTWLGCSRGWLKTYYENAEFDVEISRVSECP